MVEWQLPKLHTRVRFPSPAHFTYENEAEKAHIKPEVRTECQTSSMDGVFWRPLASWGLFGRSGRVKTAAVPSDAKCEACSVRPFSSERGLAGHCSCENDTCLAMSRLRPREELHKTGLARRGRAVPALQIRAVLGDCMKGSLFGVTAVQIDN